MKERGNYQPRTERERAMMAGERTGSGESIEAEEKRELEMETGVERGIIGEKGTETKRGAGRVKGTEKERGPA